MLSSIWQIVKHRQDVRAVLPGVGPTRPRLATSSGLPAPGGGAEIRKRIQFVIRKTLTNDETGSNACRRSTRRLCGPGERVFDVDDACRRFEPLNLKEAGAPLGCQIGIAANKAILQDPAITRFVILNFNLLTASGIKWDAIHPAPDTYDFTEADWNINSPRKMACECMGIIFAGTARPIPLGSTRVINKDNARQYLTSHITTVMERYRGRVDSWDVVNEPVVRWSHRSDGLYPGIWLCLGPEYIDVAFHAAAAADPKPLRILNIYNVEQGQS